MVFVLLEHWTKNVMVVHWPQLIPAKITLYNFLTQLCRINYCYCCCSVEYTRFHNSLLSPGVCSNSCPLSQWYHPTISSSHHLLLLQSIFTSIRVFSNGLALSVRCPKYWNFSFSISPSNVYSGLISVKVNWFALLAIQVTLKSSSITIQKHQFFGAQPSLWSNSHLCTWLLENHSFDYMDLCWQNDVYAF